MASLEQIATDSQASQGVLEMLWLLKKVKATKPKVVVEVGVHLGHSLKAWRDAFHPALLIGIDNETNPTLDAYLASDELKCKFLLADSHAEETHWQVKKLINKRKIDFLFLDGDHTFASVKRDFELYSPLVREGGIIAFHDACIKDHPLVDVHKFLSTLDGVLYYQADANGVGLLVK